MRLEIKKLHDELKSTIVYVTHDQIEAMTMATKIAVMDGGVIQQFGTPNEIYERSANLFVAGFIGSPAMNLRSAHLVVEYGRIGAEAEGVSGLLDLSDYRFAEPPRNGTRIVLGLRPEHFGPIDRPAADHVAPLELPVQYAERTGSDATSYLRTGDRLVTVRIDPSEVTTAAPGRAVRISFLRGKANVFDAQTGRRM